MDDFEAPSFSLGLDEEINETFEDHPAQQDLKQSAINSVGECQKLLPGISCKGTVNGASGADDDSDFELPPPSNIDRIFKRLKRKSPESLLASYKCSDKVDKILHASNNRTIGLQDSCKSINEKTPVPKAAGSKVHTLQNCWQGLNVKAKSKSISSSSIRDPADTNVEHAKESYRQDLFKMGSKLVKDGTERVGDSRDEEATPFSLQSEFSTLEGSERKTAHCKVNPCDEEEILLEEGSFENKGTSGGDCNFRYSVSSTDGADDGHHIEILNTSPNKAFGNTQKVLHHQRTSPYEGRSTRDDKVSATHKNHDTSIHTTSIVLDENPSETVCTEKVATAGSSGRSFEVNKRNSCVDFLTRSESGIKDNVIRSPIFNFKDVLGECPSVNASQSKADALHSFWRSLSEKNPSPHETNDALDQDDIEDCSSEDDDFEFGMQSASKLSLLGSGNLRKGFVPGNTLGDGVSGQGSGQLLYNENCTNTSSSKDFGFTPIKSFPGATANENSASQNVPHTPSTYLRHGPTFNRGTSQVSPMAIRDEPWKRQSSIPEKLPDPGYGGFAIYSFSEGAETSTQDGEFHLTRNLCKTPTSALKNGAMSICEGGSPMGAHDPRVANLLCCRFPHFISVTALRQGSHICEEQVYIDYENQFSGSKTISGQGQTLVARQQARKSAPRSTGKWRQAAQNQQKTAMADNDGWIRMGNRSPGTNHKRGRMSGSQRCTQASAKNDVHAVAGPGHWVTEKTGKRVYITRDGRKLSGSSAYKQHVKDSGKRFKKTKRRRPRAKK